MIQVKQLPITGRTIILSDIHGNLDAFIGVLDAVDMNDDDCLIINGDLSEHGAKPLMTFKTIASLSNMHNVHCTYGNCETLHLLLQEANDMDLFTYLKNESHTLLGEIADELGIKLNAVSDLQHLRKAIEETYEDLIAFACSFHHIIETDAFICAHAGIESEDLFNQDGRFVLSQEFFANINQSFTKPVIVGHYPTCLYYKDRCSHNVIFDERHNIFAIDGGNVIKDHGQINCIIYEHGMFYSLSYDELDYKHVLTNQEGKSGVFIHESGLPIDIRIKGQEFSLVYHPESNQIHEIYNEFLDFDHNCLSCDTTTAILDVHEGDFFAPLYETSRGYYGKVRGQCGWYNGVLADV